MSLLSGRSGKLTRLGEMLEEVAAAGERALVFTQYREMGDRFVAHLEHVLGDEVLYLHGGVPRTRRDALVKSFQGDADSRAIQRSGEVPGEPRRRVMDCRLW